MSGKKIAVLTAVILVFCLVAASCSAQGGVFGLYGDDVKKWASDFDSSEHYNVSIEYGDDVYVFHYTDIDTVFDGLKNLKVGEETKLDGSEGTEARMIFRPASGEIYEFSFLGDYILPGGPGSGTGYKCEGFDKIPVFNGDFPVAINEDNIQ